MGLGPISLLGQPALLGHWRINRLRRLCIIARESRLAKGRFCHTGSQNTADHNYLLKGRAPGLVKVGRPIGLEKRLAALSTLEMDGISPNGGVWRTDWI